MEYQSCAKHCDKANTQIQTTRLLMMGTKKKNSSDKTHHIPHILLWIYSNHYKLKKSRTLAEQAVFDGVF